MFRLHDAMIVLENKSIMRKRGRRQNHEKPKRTFGVGRAASGLEGLAFCGYNMHER